MLVERIRGFAIHAATRDDQTPREDLVVVEEPLEIRIEGAPLAVVMRTPGHDFELAAGLLSAEEILRTPQDLGAIAYCEDPDDPTLRNVVDVKLAPNLSDGARTVERLRAERSILTTSSCGVCGKRNIEALHCSVPAFEGAVPQLSAALVLGLTDRMRAVQEVFDSTGGLHAAALFDAEGRLLILREDIGRHNAVDKCIGALLIDERQPPEGSILLVSGRASYEIVQKALVARVRTVAAISAPSSLAVELARSSGMNLFGFVREGAFNVYAGEIPSPSSS